jgi:superoxide dismutase, Fe-Mn family
MKRMRTLFLVMMLGMVMPLISQPFFLPELPYSYDAMDPHIDAMTMEIHHSRHHRGYVTNLNNAINGTPMATLNLNELMLGVSRFGTAVRNNGGGHYNHNLFWEILSPQPQPPSETMMRIITVNFGGMEELKQALHQAGMTQFGSGWAWLIVTPERRLAVTSTANQDNPLMDVVEERGVPILGIDVWEHAYYLHYQNRRGLYLDAIWGLIDWSVVEKKYGEALTSDVLIRIPRKSE